MENVHKTREEIFNRLKNEVNFVDIIVEKYSKKNNNLTQDEIINNETPEQRLLNKLEFFNMTLQEYNEKVLKQVRKQVKKQNEEDKFVSDNQEFQINQLFQNENN